MTLLTRGLGYQGITSSYRYFTGGGLEETHLEAQQDAQVPWWHVLNLVQHVKLGLCGQRCLLVPAGSLC